MKVCLHLAKKLKSFQLDDCFDAKKKNPNSNLAIFSYVRFLSKTCWETGTKHHKRHMFLRTNCQLQVLKKIYLPYFFIWEIFPLDFNLLCFPVKVRIVVLPSFRIKIELCCFVVQVKWWKHRWWCSVENCLSWAELSRAHYNLMVKNLTWSAHLLWIVVNTRVAT